MSQMSAAMEISHMATHSDAARVLRRTIVIGLIAFLTVVDLFATQAILPSLAKAYQVTPAAMSLAVNASTLGMAVAGLFVAFFSRRIDRRIGILISLCVLAVPTSLLAVAPDLTTFAVLRVAQGLCMASAFTLTLAYLGEECSAMDAGGAFAAYITGNVASNLIGRLVSAGIADHFGLAFLFFRRDESSWRRVGLFYGSLNDADISRGRDDCTPRNLVEAFAQCAFAGKFRHRILHPVRFYRHLQLRELRSRARTAVARTDGTGSCLFRLSPFNRNHSVRRRGRPSIWHAPCLLECARACRRGASSLATAASACGACWPDVGWSRHVLRPSGGDGLCWPRCNHGSRVSEWHLSRLLFLWRVGRYRGSRSAIRPLRLGGLRFRDCGCFNRRRFVGLSFENFISSKWMNDTLCVHSLFSCDRDRDRSYRRSGQNHHRQHCDPRDEPGR